MQLSTSWARARVTLALTIVTAAVWVVLSLLPARGLGVSNLNEAAIVWGAFVPARVAELPNGAGLVPVWLTPLTASFLHANFIHLLFSLLFLAFCGRSIEPVLGSAVLGLLYLLGAYAAAAVQYLLNPVEVVPMVGATGAISALVGAYAVLFGRSNAKIRNRPLALALHVLWLLAAWIVLNILVFLSFARFTQYLSAAGGHVGAFFVGVALAIPLLLFRYRKA